MGQDKSQVGTPVENEQKSPEELRREIEETRQDLGDTAAALAEKTDVKARAKEKVAGVKQSVSEKTDAPVAAQAKTTAQQNPVAVAAVAALVAGFVLGRLTAR